jgi:osmotically-inducible protein OsmY
MVGFSDNATVTFVPFFATAPEAGASGADPTTAEPPGTARLGAESGRPETDRVIALKVAHALAALQVPILRTLEVSVHEGHVTLRGRVRTYYERQLAHAHARRTAGVKSVRGEISVAG